MGVSSKRMQEIDKYLNKKDLKKYLKIYSANYIATKLFAPQFITTAGTVIDRAKSYGIQSHSISSANKLANTQKTKIKSCNDKWGVDYISQAQEIKIKKEKTMICKYGVKNGFQSKEIQAKSKETMMRKYGVPHIGMAHVRASGYLSKFHQEISDRLTLQGIEHDCEVYGKFRKFNPLINREYSPVVDILLKNQNVVIECYGDFWHANPRFYLPTDIFYTWEGRETAQEIWNRDKNRISQIESFSYKVIIVWESELRHNRQTTIERIINEIEQDNID